MKLFDISLSLAVASVKIFVYKPAICNTSIYIHIFVLHIAGLIINDRFDSLSDNSL
jgi:hypothetical protein